MPSVRQLRQWALLGLLAIGTLRCGGDKVDPPTPTAIAPVAGDEQTGIVGQTLADPLVVQVTDAAGDAVDGVGVQWNAQGAGSVSATAVTTGPDGRASVTRVLGSASGEQTTTASVTGLQGSPVTFVSTAADANGPRLAIQTQPSNVAQSGAALAVQPVVQLQNADGSDRAESGVAVTATIASGTGTLGGTATQSTAADGAATFTDLAITGPAGSYTLQFTAPGTLSVSSTAITITAGASTLAITINPPTSALSGEVFEPQVQPVVEAKDGAGTPIPGVVVTASIGSGGGTLGGAPTATTDAAGIARFADLGITGTGSPTLLFTAGTTTVTSSPVGLSPLPTQATTGSWGPVVNWDIVPLHMTLLPTGKILVWGKTDATDTIGKPRLWDPAVGLPSAAPKLSQVDTMLFCAGHTLMPDGSLMVSGGHRQDDAGLAVTNFFSADGVWTKGPDMAHGRWYPTVTTLPDGRMLTMAGRNGTGAVVKIPEIWEGGQWVELPGASAVEIPYYPRNFVVPNDNRIFYAGERIRSRWFDINGTGTGGGRGSWSDGPNHRWGFNRDYGTAVMYEPGKILYT
ncbi:MAG: hypothetical protein M3Q93_04145, partial [Gemmatimonadota bacterium]|nr:hypothetical protein [Gemmatimonadota bacterium]